MVFGHQTYIDIVAVKFQVVEIFLEETFSVNYIFLYEYFFMMQSQFQRN